MDVKSWLVTLSWPTFVDSVVEISMPRVTEYVICNLRFHFRCATWCPFTMEALVEEQDDILLGTTKIVIHYPLTIYRPHFGRAEATKKSIQDNIWGPRGVEKRCKHVSAS